MKKFFLSIFLLSVPFNSIGVFASELLIASNDDDQIEEVANKKVNKNGKLIVRFCEKLKDFNGYVEVDNKKFLVDDADIIKPRRIVWENSGLPKQGSEDISVDNLVAKYYKEDSNEPLRVVDDGSCGVGILPFIIIGAGAAIGGSGGGSGSSSHN